MVVEHPYIIPSYGATRHSQIDKYKGLLDGSPAKKGLALQDERLKKTTIPMDKVLQDPPVSMYLAENWENPEKKGNFFERKLDLTKTISPVDFTRNIKESHQHTMIYKPMKNVFD